MQFERPILISLAALLSACATTKPCSKGGDVSWPNPIQGDKVCYQKTDKNGLTVNEGNYRQHYADGKVAVEGEFKNGKRDGFWYQYDESGNKTLEKYYEDGVEKAPPLPPASKK